MDSLGSLATRSETDMPDENQLFMAIPSNDFIIYLETSDGSRPSVRVSESLPRTNWPVKVPGSALTSKTAPLFRSRLSGDDPTILSEWLPCLWPRLKLNSPLYLSRRTKQEGKASD